MTYDQSWFEKMWRKKSDTILEDLWSREFRVSPGRFEFIIDLVRPNMERQVTCFKEAIKIGERL